MRLRNRFHASNEAMGEIAPEIGDRKMREFWRELARLITLFDEASPANIPAGEIGEFFSKWCARRDSNPLAPSEARCGVTWRSRRGATMSERSESNGAPAATRTRDPRLRSPMFYPGELRASTVLAKLVGG